MKIVAVSVAYCDKDKGRIPYYEKEQVLVLFYDVCTVHRLTIRI